MNIRQKTLLEKLKKLGTLSIEEEADHFSVSTMTIRRDIQLFEEHGLAIRTHGGAVPRVNDPSQLFIQAKSTEAQKHIAAKTIELISPGSTIMLSTGTTTLEVARQLATSSLQLSVVTNSLPIAATLYQTQIQVILTGGTLRSNSLDLTGPVTEKNIDEYYIDTLITGCDGAIAQEGFFTKDMNLAEMEKKSVKKSRKVIVTTESHKFNNPSFVKFASTKEVSVLVTDKKISDNDKHILASAGMKVFAC